MSEYAELGLAQRRPTAPPLRSKATRTLARIVIDEEKLADSANLVERLMGKKPEARFQFIQENATFIGDALDI